jgi:hypothetical protein
MSDCVATSLSTNFARVLYVRLPCNPIFPIGVVYLADHIGKVLPQVEQRILDLGAVPPLDLRRTLDQVIGEFQPTLLVYSWRDIQIYAPVGGRGATPCKMRLSFTMPAIPWLNCGGRGGSAAGECLLRRVVAQSGVNQAGVTAGSAILSPGGADCGGAGRSASFMNSWDSSCPKERLFPWAKGIIAGRLAER